MQQTQQEKRQVPTTSTIREEPHVRDTVETLLYNAKGS